MIITGDCLEVMKTFPDNHFSSIVTDPPYGLSFMGKGWDHAVPGREYWTECHRIVKPGGNLLAMGGTRTFHRLTSAIEDSGWEIRDCISWLYGSGFPKSHNHFGIEGYGTALKPAHEPIILASKPYEISHLLAIILLDLTNEVYLCQKSSYYVKDAEESLSDSLVLLDRVQKHIVQENAKIFAWEKLLNVPYVIKNAMSLVQELKEKTSQEKELFALIAAKDFGNSDMLAKKILSGEVECIFAAIRDIVTFVIEENIEQNIALLWKSILVGIYQGANKFTTKTVISLITELRILKSCLRPNILESTGNFSPNWEPCIVAMKPCDGTFKQNAEKWGQAGINIDGCRISTTDDIRGISSSSSIWGEGNSKNVESNGNLKGGRWPANVILDEESSELLDQQVGFSASRFFYCAKASSAERNEGLNLDPKPGGIKNTSGRGFSEADPMRSVQYKNNHPTVKPLKLMEYLIKLVMPPKNGLLLDPFAGSGTTILAAKRLGFDAIGIEKSEEYSEIARARINAYKGPNYEKELF